MTYGVKIKITIQLCENSCVRIWTYCMSCTAVLKYQCGAPATIAVTEATASDMQQYNWLTSGHIQTLCSYNVQVVEQEVKEAQMKPTYLIIITSVPFTHWQVNLLYL
jgi:hypothetical protein